MKIGILGGTFDPIHKGHLVLAEEAYQLLRLDKVLFVPAYIPPHKDPATITPIEHRLKMLELALDEFSFIEISEVEVSKKEVCYTIDTLRELKEIYPEDTEFFFLVGSDFVQDYKTWKEPNTLISLATFIIAVRPGFAISSIPEGMRLLEGNFPFISSTDIRIIVRHGEYLDEQLPRVVFNYIKKNKLYNS